MATTDDALGVLIAEDNSLVLMSLEGLLEDLEWRLIGPARTLDAALRLAERDDIDVALLDVNLGDQVSHSVADRLRARGIPFLFATGDADHTNLPAHLRDAELIAKPYALDDLEGALRRLAAGAPSA
ncbi:MAG: response regulator [Pseudomonadota bacterium]